MKFWTAGDDVSSPDSMLLVEMIQCEQCHRWIPPDNMELHHAYNHKTSQQQNQDNGNEKTSTTTSSSSRTSSSSPKNYVDDHADESLPAFVMETIPCEDCQVLVPKSNWMIHQAHGCRGRRRRRKHTDSFQRQQDEFDATTVWENDRKNLLISTTTTITTTDVATIKLPEPVECEACGCLIPLHNLELHLARACTALYGPYPPPSPPEPDPTQAPAIEKVRHNNDYDTDHASSKYYFDTMDEWGCPRCTFTNHERFRDDDWKCTMCNFALVTMKMTSKEQQDSSTKTPSRLSTSSLSEQQQHQQQPTWSTKWQHFVTSWVPREYHTLMLDKDVVCRNETERRKQRKQMRKHHKNQQEQQQEQQQQQQQQTKKKAPQPPPVLVPTPQEVRHHRNHHLSMLERERQQYWQLLQTTRREKQTLQQQQRSTITAALVSVDKQNEFQQHQHQHQTSQRQEQHQHQQEELISRLPNQQFELLLATEQLCLQHLEQLRRTSLIETLSLHINLLGLERWRRHLHHLCDLYQSANELYVDGIIWEVRMHFQYYATMEMMALLELAIWKYQMNEARTQQEEQGVTTCSKNDSSSMTKNKWSIRNDRDIRIICQSVLPYMGRPQTWALRAM